METKKITLLEDIYTTIAALFLAFVIYGILPLSMTLFVVGFIYGLTEIIYNFNIFSVSILVGCAVGMHITMIMVNKMAWWLNA